MYTLTPTAGWTAAITEWADWMRAGDSPETTIYTRTYQLKRLAVELAPQQPYDVTLATLSAWFAGHHGWRTETRRSFRGAIRAFYAWAVLFDRLPASPAAKLPPIRPSDPNPRPVPRAIVRAAALTTTDPRVLLMLRIADTAGMRRGEISRVHTDDLSRDLIGWSLLVHGKGGRLRTVPLVNDLGVILSGLPTGWVFPGDDHGHLSPAWVGKLMSRALAGHWTAHTLRHGVATRIVEETGDVTAAQRLLGHAHLDTTMRYVRVADTTLRAAMLAAA